MFHCKYVPHRLYPFLGWCAHVLASVNSAAINIGVHVSFLSRVFSGYMTMSGIAGSYGSSIFSLLWCWGRLLRVPCTAWRLTQSLLKETSPSSEGITLKLQFFGHLMQRADCLEKTLEAEKIEGKRRRGWQRMWQLDSITDSTDMNLSKFLETVKNREASRVQSMGSQRVRHNLATENTCTTRHFSTLFSIVAAPIHIPTDNGGKVPCSPAPLPSSYF